MLYGELKNEKLPGDDSAVYSGFLFRTLNPQRAAVLRLPSSDEMTLHIESQESVRYDLGREGSKSDPVVKPEKDIAFFERLRVAGDDFTPIGARNAIAKLTACEVEDREREGDQYRITLRTPFGKLIHYLKIPLDQALYNYRRGVVVVTSKEHNRENVRFRATPAVELYDSCFVKAEGYADGVDVPAHHKFAVAGDLSQACAAEEDFDPLS